jgi:hypothetical protein
MASLTIDCSIPSRGPVSRLGAWTKPIQNVAHKNGEWQKVKSKKTRSKKVTVEPKSRRASFPAIGNAVAHKATGSWGKKLIVKDSSTVAHTTRHQPKVEVKVDDTSAKKKDWERRHAYWMMKQGEKQATKKKEKQEMRAARIKQAEDVLAAKFATHPVDDAINRGHVSVRSRKEKVNMKNNRFNRLSEDDDFKPPRRVSFWGDNPETIMKPPCETKVYHKEDPPSAISSDEECQVLPDEVEYLKRKRTKTAWKPKFQMTAHEQQKNLDAEKKVKKKSWADMCDDESDDEDDFDQFGRPTTDNSAW